MIDLPADASVILDSMLEEFHLKTAISGEHEMTDKVSITLTQTRDNKVICEVTATWTEMKDWEANKVVRDIVDAVNEKAGEWDKALTGGVPARK